MKKKIELYLYNSLLPYTVQKYYTCTCSPGNLFTSSVSSEYSQGFLAPSHLFVGICMFTKVMKKIFSVFGRILFLDDFSNCDNMLLEARQVLISGFCWKKPGLLPAPLLSILAGSPAGWRGAASFELLSPQFFSNGDSWGFQDPWFWACQVACCKTWSPNQAGYKSVIPLHRKFPNSWCSFFCKTD